MSLPYVVEYLLSYLDSLDRSYTVQNSTRIDVTLIPGEVNSQELAVRSGKHAYILYQIQWSPDIVPDALHMNLAVQGNQLYNDVIGDSLLSEPYGCFAVIPYHTPAQLVITNQSLVNQRFEVVLHYITVPSEGDFTKILQVLPAKKSNGIDTSQLITALEALYYKRERR